MNCAAGSVLQMKRNSCVVKPVRRQCFGAECLSNSWKTSVNGKEWLFFFKILLEPLKFVLFVFGLKFHMCKSHLFHSDFHPRLLKATRGALLCRHVQNYGGMFHVFSFRTMATAGCQRHVFGSAAGHSAEWARILHLYVNANRVFSPRALNLRIRRCIVRILVVFQDLWISTPGSWVFNRHQSSLAVRIGMISIHNWRRLELKHVETIIQNRYQYDTINYPHQYQPIQ